VLGPSERERKKGGKYLSYVQHFYSIPSLRFFPRTYSKYLHKVQNKNTVWDVFLLEHLKKMKGRQYLSFVGELTPKITRPIYDFGKKTDEQKSNKKTRKLLV